jgi:hypothetical protein
MGFCGFGGPSSTRLWRWRNIFRGYRRGRGGRDSVDDRFDTGSTGGDLLRSQAGGVIRNLAGEGDDAVFGADIDRGGLQEWLGV